MPKPFTFLLLFLISLWGLNFQIRGQSTPKVETLNALPPDPPIDIISLKQSEVTLTCPPGTRAKSGNCSDETIVKVQISLPKPTQKREDLKYTISGGKIIGEGENLGWDLKGVRPGRYTITVQIEDFSQTKEITVRECPECGCGYCECPSSISISGPSSPTKIGEDMVFTVNTSGGSQDEVKYKWKVTEGTIIGQGTSTISIKTTNEMRGHTITATVEVGGLCEACPNTASSSSKVTDK